MPYVDRFCEVTGVPRDLLDVTVDTHGNVASATLPLQLSRQWDRPRARRQGAAARPRRRRLGDGDAVGEVVSPGQISGWSCPAYDEEATLPATLAALAAQTDADFTLVVVDNGSRDRTAAIARDFATHACRSSCTC